MMSFDTLLFCCAICEREVRDYPDRKDADRQVAPICRYCERNWTEGAGKPKAGAMMDRRNALRILALTNALHNIASVREWESRYGRS